MLLAEVVVSHALRSPIPGSEPPSQAGAPHTCWLHKPLRGPTPVSGLSLSLPTPGPIPLASLLSHSQAAGATQHPTSPTSQARPASSEGRGSGGACLWPRPPGGVPQTLRTGGCSLQCQISGRLVSISQTPTPPAAGSAPLGTGRARSVLSGPHFLGTSRVGQLKPPFGTQGGSDKNLAQKSFFKPQLAQTLAVTRAESLPQVHKPSSTTPA